MSIARTPNNIEGLAAQSDITSQKEYLFSHNGALDVNETVSSIVGSGIATEATLADMNSTAYWMKRVYNILQSNAVVDTANRQRIVIDSLPGAAVTTTIPISGSVTATVASTTITQIGGIDPRFQYIDAARNAYANGIRQNLTFS